MNLIEYIDYFEENYISFDFLQNSNNVHISINTEKNNVNISNEYSRNHICIGVETNSEDLESLTPPITIRIYNKNYRIFPTSTILLVAVEDARIKIRSIYDIEIS